jgi:hypothetical protein
VSLSDCLAAGSHGAALVGEAQPLAMLTTNGFPAFRLGVVLFHVVASKQRKWGCSALATGWRLAYAKYTVHPHGTQERTLEIDWQPYMRERL